MNNKKMQQHPEVKECPLQTRYSSHRTCQCLFFQSRQRASMHHPFLQLRAPLPQERQRLSSVLLPVSLFSSEFYEIVGYLSANGKAEDILQPHSLGLNPSLQRFRPKERKNAAAYHSVTGKWVERECSLFPQSTSML